MGAAPRHALVATRPRADLVDRLAGRLERVSLEGVLADPGRAAEACAVPAAAAGGGLTWDEADRDDPVWWPQGIASLPSGGVLLVSWYGRRRRSLRGPGTRISVVDRTDPDRPRYRHVLLVRPRRRLGILTAGAVRVHAGGIAVHRGLLYVADTVSGVRVFRLADVMRAPRRRGGRGRRASRGHEHVLPQYVAYRVPLRSALRGLRHSFLSVGTVDGRPELVVGEYRRNGQAAPRLVRFPLDPVTGLPAADSRGTVAPRAVYEDQPRRMQGVAVHGSTWFVTASAGPEVGGDLYVGAPGRWRRHRRVLPAGPEDLAWSVPGEELWCVSEWPGRRWVFPVAADRWRGPEPEKR
ncbi:hypothetical protein [Geodermatophilus nigrescens]|uniref:Uncharacterized protein n=1 Tax=Geodermatophilus nigrescens TaxID=1070870 RepID=A0A1M5HQE8_9ACTN|nr:hypothetical protein [Geodermatophilus nigrescens]SHG18173.1 hypothetical protein SAMN05444351_1694 [Geodermatophilus nigrescens]